MNGSKGEYERERGYKRKEECKMQRGLLLKGEETSLMGRGQDDSLGSK